jgi:hypothetical protein
MSPRRSCTESCRCRRCSRAANCTSCTACRRRGSRPRRLCRDTYTSLPALRLRSTPTTSCYTRKPLRERRLRSPSHRVATCSPGYPLYGSLALRRRDASHVPARGAMLSGTRAVQARNRCLVAARLVVAVRLPAASRGHALTRVATAEQLLRVIDDKRVARGLRFPLAVGAGAPLQAQCPVHGLTV